MRQNRGAINFYEKDIFDFAGKTSRLPELKAAAARVADCLKDYQKFLENDLLPRANGEWRLGTEQFKRKFDLQVDAGRSADEGIADAEAEFARVERDRYVIRRQLLDRKFPEQPV